MKHGIFTKIAYASFIFIFLGVLFSCAEMMPSPDGMDPPARNVTIASAVYEHSSSLLTVTGTNFEPMSTIVASKLTLSYGNSNTYTLVDTADGTVASATEFSLTLGTVDALNAHGLINKSGVAANDAATFTLGFTAGWNGSSSAAISGTPPLTISTLPSAPVLTAVAYDGATSVLSLTGTNFVRVPGESDIDVGMVTLTGESGSTGTYTLTSDSSASIASSTSASISLGALDQSWVGGILNKMGTASDDGTTYNVALAAGWNRTGSAALPTLAINVTSVATSAITSAQYNEAASTLTLGGQFIRVPGATSDIDASDILISADGTTAGTALTTATNDVDLPNDSGTSLTLTLAEADKDAVVAALAAGGLHSEAMWNGINSTAIAIGNSIRITASSPLSVSNLRVLSHNGITGGTLGWDTPAYPGLMGYAVIVNAGSSETFAANTPQNVMAVSGTDPTFDYTANGASTAVVQAIYSDGRSSLSTLSFTAPRTSVDIGGTATTVGSGTGMAADSPVILDGAADGNLRIRRDWTDRKFAFQVEGLPAATYDNSSYTFTATIPSGGGTFLGVIILGTESILGDSAVSDVFIDSYAGSTRLLATSMSSIMISASETMYVWVEDGRVRDNLYGTGTGTAQIPTAGYFEINIIPTP